MIRYGFGESYEFISTVFAMARTVLFYGSFLDLCLNGDSKALSAHENGQLFMKMCRKHLNIKHEAQEKASGTIKYMLHIFEKQLCGTFIDDEFDSECA